MGGGLSKIVGEGRLALLKGGRWEVETPATPPLYNVIVEFVESVLGPLG